MSSLCICIPSVSFKGFVFCSLVAAAATVDRDGVKLGLCGNSHSGVDLDAEIIISFILFSKYKKKVFLEKIFDFITRCVTVV